MSFHHRKDHRSEQQFTQDIYNGTLKENILATMYEREMQHRGIQMVMIPNSNGRDGSVINSTNFKSGADFCAKYPDGTIQYIEIASCGLKTKVTFVKSRLQTYINNNYSLLLFINTGITRHTPSHKISQILHSNKNIEFCLLKPEQIQRLIEENQAVKNYSFGNKISILIEAKDFHKYFLFQQLTYMLLL